MDLGNTFYHEHICLIISNSIAPCTYITHVFASDNGDDSSINSDRKIVWLKNFVQLFIQWFSTARNVSQKKAMLISSFKKKIAMNHLNFIVLFYGWYLRNSISTDCCRKVRNFHYRINFKVLKKVCCFQRKIITMTSTYLSKCFILTPNPYPLIGIISRLCYGPRELKRGN